MSDKFKMLRKFWENISGTVEISGETLRRHFKNLTKNDPEILNKLWVKVEHIWGKIWENCKKSYRDFKWN